MSLASRHNLPMFYFAERRTADRGELGDAEGPGKLYLVDLLSLPSDHGYWITNRYISKLHNNDN